MDSRYFSHLSYRSHVFLLLEVAGDAQVAYRVHVDGVVIDVDVHIIAAVGAAEGHKHGFAAVAVEQGRIDLDCTSVHAAVGGDAGGRRRH